MAILFPFGRGGRRGRHGAVRTRGAVNGVVPDRCLDNSTGEAMVEIGGDEGACQCDLCKSDALTHYADGTRHRCLEQATDRSEIECVALSVLVGMVWVMIWEWQECAMNPWEIYFERVFVAS